MPDRLQKNHETVPQGKHSRERTHKPLPRGQQALILSPVTSDVQLGPFCVSGHGPTAKTPYLPLPINT